MTTPAIEIQNVQKHMGAFMLGPISLSVPRGAIFGLIGPNGAGKTTLLDLLMGMGQPGSGTIKLLGRDLKNDEVEIKRRTAYVSPDLNYQAWGTVGRAIAFVSGFYPDWDQARCERLQVELGVHPTEKVAALSFGARIKLSLIMALSRDAELLLLDEPTVGLDAVSRRQLFTELLALIQKEDRTIVISSHHLPDLERFTDHVAILHRGKVLTSGRMDELIDRYCQVHVRTARNFTLLPGVQVLKRDTERSQLLVDLSVCSRESLARSRIEIIGETRLTLEELFLALVTSHTSD
jgi:ABC-2 type transport system ATP-binding protein